MRLAGFLALLTLCGAAMNSQARRSTETWYEPVDIGQHLNPPVPPAGLIAQSRALELFEGGKPGLLSAAGLAFFTSSEVKHPAPGDHSADRAYQAFKGNPEARVHRFSKAKLRIWVVQKTGFSRWHSFSDLLADYTFDRNSKLDAIFKMGELEPQYAATYKGVGHGLPLAKALEILGREYREYPGQSPSFRNLYFEKDNLELTVQSGIVKYITRGRPGWLGAGE